VDLKRVKPYVVNQSYLADKISESSSTRTGSRMPSGGPYLTDDEVGRIKRWIITGADQGAADPDALYFGAPSLSRVDLGGKVSSLPVGVAGQVSVPMLSDFTPPLKLSLDLGKGEHGDAFFDSANLVKDKSLRLYVGGNKPLLYAVSAAVEDANGKSGTFDIDVTLTTDGANALSYKSDIEPLIVKRCSSCHATVAPVLSEKRGYKSLVDKPSTKSGWNYVTPGSVSKSYVLYKLYGWETGTPGQTTKPMPHHMDLTNAADVNEFLIPLTNWMLGGAKP